MTHIKPYEVVLRVSESVIRKVSESLGPWRVGYWKGNFTVAMVTEIIDMNDGRASCTKMKGAIRCEIERLVNKVTFEVVDRMDVPQEANILVGRFVHAFKDPRTKYERSKARFFVQGYREKDKSSLVLASPNLRQDSTRVFQ